MTCDFGLFTAGSGGGGGASAVIILDSGTCSSVRCGASNVSSGSCTSVLSGTNNCATCNGATIVGGNKNCSINPNSFIGSGLCNKTTLISGLQTIVGGCFNCSVGRGNVIGSGCSHRIDGCKSPAASHNVILGGIENESNICFSSISGGCCNKILTFLSSIGGGACNQTVACCSSLSGGYKNSINNLSDASAITGGCENNVYFLISSVVGGWCNSVCNNCSSIIGGCKNTVKSPFSSIDGGACNLVCNYGSIIGGGLCNQIISDGTYNVGTGGSVIIGGFKNQSNSCYSVVVGGDSNIICCIEGYFSAIGGGQCNTIETKKSFIGAGCLNCISINGNVGVSAGFNVIFTGNENKICERGFRTILGGYQNIIATTNAEQEVIGGGYCNLISSQGAGDVIVGGYTNCIFITNSGYQNTIVSGRQNIINDYDVCYNLIGGGCLNIIDGNSNGGTLFNTILSGHSNRIQSDITCSAYNVIAGGSNNQMSVSAYNSTIASGCCNRISGEVLNQSIASGLCNSITTNNIMSIENSIGGGNDNSVCGDICNSTILSGRSNKICRCNCNATIIGGWNNLIDSNPAFPVFQKNNTIAGGRSNCICGGAATANKTDGNTIIGGTGNFITTNSSYNVISGAGNNITLCSNYSVASTMGGQIIESNYSTILGGCISNICGAGEGFSTILNDFSGILRSGYSVHVNNNTTTSGAYIGQIFVANSNSGGQKNFQVLTNTYNVSEQEEYNVSLSNLYGVSAGLSELSINNFNYDSASGYNFTLSSRNSFNRGCLSYVSGSNNTLCNVPRSGIFQGCGNTVSCYYGATQISKVIVNGCLNYIYECSNEYATIISGCTNWICGNHSFIGGGGNVKIYAACHTSVNQGTNQTLGNPSYPSCFSFISNGDSNIVEGCCSAIINGQSNIICCDADFAIIGNGTANYITNVGVAAIFNGSDNCVIGGKNGSIIGGGSTNSIYDNNFAAGFQAVGAGTGNRISTNKSYMVIGGGNNNCISASDYNNIGGGNSNCITSGGRNLILAGRENCIIADLNDVIISGESIEACVSCAFHANTLFFYSIPTAPPATSGMVYSASGVLKII